MVETMADTVRTVVLVAGVAFLTLGLATFFVQLVKSAFGGGV